MNIKKELETKIGIADDIYLNNITIDPHTIQAIMINEVVPSDPLQDFYGSPDADYLKTTIPLLQGAGTQVTSIPAVSTYKLRNREIYYEGIRVMPSYIMTGKNILIEKLKATMATEDIAAMLKIIK